MTLGHFRQWFVVLSTLLLFIGCGKDDETASKRTTSWEAEETFLVSRPKTGPTWVVDLQGTSTAEQLFMRTLQGTINHAKARVYLVRPDDGTFGEGEQFWIDEYERRGWVTVKGRLTMDQAIEKFGPEVDGFVTATEQEPWSIHAATVIATLQNGVVAPDAVADKLRDAGWQELGDTRGKWADAVSAYEATVAEYKDRLAYPGVALLRHTEELWDFVVQQEIMPLFSRPKHDTWDGVAAIIDQYPAGQVLYGYVSDDTVEEEIAVDRTSSSGKYLVPTSRVSNLSFHVAVRGRAPLHPVEERPEDQAIPECDSSKVNVAIAITDGDNLQIPIMQYPQANFWNTPERGSLPLGWSMGVSLSTVAPGIWDFYRSTILPNDEIVAIMGIAYVHAHTLPEPSTYYSDTFAAMADTGTHTLWSLDSTLTITDEPLWDTLESANHREALNGVVVGYGPSIDKAFRRETGTPVLITQNGYSEDASRVKERVEAIMKLDPAVRSPVNFLMATNWDAPAKELYEALKPLAEQGVRFLTPAQALACMPNIEGKARITVNNQASPGECLPVGEVQQFGSSIVSAPTLAEINKPITMPLTPAVSASPTIPAGGNIEYTANLEIDAHGFAKDFLENRVLPVVEGYGLSAEFAEKSWNELSATSVFITLPLPEDTAPLEIGATTSSGIGASAKFEGSSLVITLDSFTADSRKESSPATVSVSWTVKHKATTQAKTLELGAEDVRLSFALTVGIGDDESLVGGVSGLMSCPGPGILAQTTVE